MMEREGRTLKTRIFDAVRFIFRLRPLESTLVRLASGRRMTDFATRLLPKPYQYPQGRTRRVSRNGIQLVLDPSDGVDWFGFFGLRDEPREQLLALLADGDVLIDVGANVGLVTLPAAVRVGRGGRVIAVEPAPVVRARLEEAVRRNGFDHVQVVSEALGQSPGQASMEVPDPHNSGKARMTDGATDDSSIEVTVTTLDELMGRLELEHVSALKIDVEGNDLQVLRGAEQLIAEHRPLLLVEVVDSLLRQRGDTPAELLSWLEERGYVLERAGDGGPVSPKDPLDGCFFDVLARPRPGWEG